MKDVHGADTEKAAIIGHEKYDTTKRMYQSAEVEAMKRIIEQL